MTASLDDLVARLQDVVDRERTPKCTAAAVADLLRTWPDSILDMLSDAHRGTSSDAPAQHVLHADPDGAFSAVAIVWLPGQTTAVHDHVCWCVVTVLQGAETEIIHRLEPDDNGHVVAVPACTRKNRQGSVAVLVPPGDVHRVMNTSEETVISLHIYGANIAALGTSIRRRYPALESGSTPQGATCT